MKKIIALLLVLSTMMSGASVQRSTAAVSGFTDMVSTDWYYLNVMELVNRGIINGYPDGKFKPLDQMTADQFIKTMIVAMGYKIENGKGYWAQPFIDKAIALGLVKVGEFTTYKEPITRAQMSVIVVRVVEKLEGAKTYKYDVMENIELLASIKDLCNIEIKYKEPISHAYELGILGGYPDGSFLPEKALPRSEACTVIRRVIDTKERLELPVFDDSVTWKTTVINGWTLPLENETVIDYYIGTAKDIAEGRSEISLVIYLGSYDFNLLQQHQAVRQALLSKYNTEFVEQVMDYVRLKTYSDSELKIKVFPVNGKYIWVYSGPNSGISIQLFNVGVVD